MSVFGKIKQTVNAYWLTKIAISSYPVELGNLDKNSFVCVTYTASL